jgi:large subunit ribosomal protein L15
MLNHSTLRPRATSRTTSKRLGRGSSSGKGGFCGRGCKGQKARTGKKIHPLFEGGQTPLHMRLPKLRGGAFSTKMIYSVIHLSDVATLVEQGHKEITIQTLLDTGYVRGKSPRVKLLSGGELTKPVTLSVHAVSGAAKQSLEKVGGTLTLVV